MVIKWNSDKSGVNIFGEENMFVPVSNPMWKQLGLTAKDEAGEILPYKTIEESEAEMATDERAWRDAELLRADTELNKVQDGDGTGLVSDWREYRCALRKYPKQPDFPNGERPKVVITK